MEGSAQADGENYNRGMFDANISQRDLADSYLPPFRACVEKGNV
jgi:beta-glucosidase-like glycosyl hydrolase